MPPDPVPEDDPARDPFVQPTVEEELAREPSRLRRFLKILGPGLISGASNDDPSAIATYANAGAAFGFQALWMAPLLFPMMATVVYVCGKIGMVSGRGLAEVLRDFYPRWVVYPAVLALALANVIGAGADLGAIAAGIGLLVPVRPVLLVLPIALAILALEAWGSYRIVSTVSKWLALALLAYVGAGLLARPAAWDVLRHTLVPTLRTDPHYLSTIVAMIGTALSPYLYFWQASQQVLEERERGRVRLRQRLGATDAELRIASLDVNVGMLFACVVIYFIVLACGATLPAAGVREVGSAADAARALEPLAGRAAGLLFALGLVGAGLLAVPVLTGGAAHALAEAFNWRYGFDRRPSQARRFYAVLAAVTAAAVGINFLGINPIRALLLAAIVNGLLAPPLLALVMISASRRIVMGDRVNGRLANAIGWATTAVCAAASIALLVTLLH